jgi:Sec-independent protein translocase protein TatA
LAILACIVVALAIFGLKKVVDTMRQDAASVGALRQMPDPAANRQPPVPAR